MNKKKTDTGCNTGGEKKSLDVLAIIISLFALVISGITFLVSTFPQINKISDNYVEKAKAGDTYSQVYLAETYRRTGKIQDSIYWYGIVAEKDSSIRADALNNLGALLANYGPFDQYDSEFYYRVFNYFQRASEMDNLAATRNLYILLKSNPAEAFPGVDSEEVIISASKLLMENNLFDDELKNYQSEWVLINTTTDLADYYRSHSEVNEDTEYQIITTKVELVPNEKTGVPQWLHTYSIYAKNVDTATIPYIYIEITPEDIDNARER